MPRIERDYFGLYMARCISRNALEMRQGKCELCIMKNGLPDAVILNYRLTLALGSDITQESCIVREASVSLLSIHQRKLCPVMMMMMMLLMMMKLLLHL